MNHWLANSLQHLPLGDALNAPLQELLKDRQSPAVLFWKSRTGAERWQAAMHEVKAPTSLADSFKSRMVASGG